MRFYRFIFIFVLFSFNALASTETSRAWNSLDNFSASLTSNYHGATLADPGSSSTLDNHGNLKATSNFDSEARFAYKLTNNMSIGPVVPFVVLNRPDRNGDSFIMGDAGVRFSQNRAIATDNFVVNTNLILQAPTSDSSKARGMTYAIKTTPNARYTFKDARFSAGSLTEGKYYANVTVDKTLKLWAMPFVNFKQTSNFSWNLGYEMEWHRDVGRGAMEFTTYQKDLQPGVIWEITKKISVNPYLQFYTNKALSFRDAGIGAFITAAMI
jgi:hypothetical protein